MEGKGIAAIINASKAINGRLHYAYSGDRNNPKEYTCTITARISGEDSDRSVSVTLELGMSDSHERGALPRWKKDPDQMLAYYGARVWARRFTPEIIAGLYTPEEMMAIPGAKIDRDYRTQEEIEAERAELIEQYQWDIAESQTIDDLNAIYKDVKKNYPEVLNEVVSMLSKRKASLIAPPIIKADEEIMDEVKNEMD